MRQRLTVILTIVVIIGVLALVSSISYVKKEKVQDLEIAPNRSTYHAGPTGVRALYDFLSESGYKVIRWKETPQKLLSDSGKLVKTFVVVGQIQVRFTEAESEALKRWIAAGGHVVFIDRHVEQDRDSTEPGGWKISARRIESPTFDVNPADVNQMTDKVVAVKPVQPTVLTRNIQSVLPSRFAARISLEAVPAGHPQSDTTTESTESDEEEPPPPAQATPISPAPVVHLVDDKGALLIDYAYGSGRVSVLTDPYIVSNGGIKLEDNLQLATNMLTEGGGLIAFDE